MDKIDNQLIQLLGENARQSSYRLATKLKLSPTTVRRRIRKLIQSGVLRIVATVDPDKVGFPLSAIIGFDVDQDKVNSALQALASMPEVKWLSTSTGQFDLLALTRFRSPDELSDFLQKELTGIKGLKNTETFICLRVEKGKHMRVIT